MNSNVSMKQPNQGNSQYHHLFSTVYPWSNAIPKLPSPVANSTHLHLTHSHFRYNLLYCGEIYSITLLEKSALDTLAGFS